MVLRRAPVLPALLLSIVAGALEPESTGLGVFIVDSACGTAVGHGGSNSGFTSQSLVYPEHGVGYVFLANNEQGGDLLGGTRACGAP